LEASGLIVSAIAEALDFELYQTDDARRLLLDYLREQTLLLVLDNFEHLLDGARFISDLLADAPGVKVLVTSREALNLQEEWLYPVKGMRFPQDDGLTNLEDYSAVRLFVQHARRIRADFSLAEEAAGVVRICALVEGMPLGIELAAAWVRALSCAEIAAEIERSLDILVTPARNATERHRNMRVVLEQSWKRLSDAERVAFKKLSVFRGGITRQAAQLIAGSSLATLSALVDKSFVRHDSNERYTVHELLRQYGEEQLDLSPEEAARVRDEHCRYFGEFMHQRARDVKGRRQLAALDEIEADFENVRMALYWALRQKNYQAVNQALESLFLFCEMRGRFQDGKELLQQACTQLDAESDRALRPIWARALTLGTWLWNLKEDVSERHEATRAQLERSLTTAQAHGDEAQRALCLWVLGAFTMFVGQYAEALPYFEQSLQVFQALDDRFYMARAADWLGAAYGMNGNHASMVTYSQRCLDWRRAIGDRYGVAQALVNLTEAAINIGQYEEAEHYAQEMGTIYVEIGSRGWVSRRSICLAKIAFEKGEFQKAEALAKEGLEILRNTGGLVLEVGPAALVLLGKLAALEEDYVRSWQLCERAVFKIGFPGFASHPQEGLAIAACGLEEYRTARHYLIAALRIRADTHDTRGLVSLLPLAAVILAREGQKTYAVELLGMAFSRPARAKDWLDKWPLLTRLRGELEDELGAEAFAGAWERGKAGNLDTTVDRILKRFGTETGQALPAANQPVMDPLTERELEVLHLMAEGMSNREVAERLVIAVGTAKWYVSQIMSKLGAQNRLQAIARARELNLLS
jgi:predicted ATPase/DNA-binding CsgD family transcriptional regulator